jgi:hypothetical protein
MPDFLLAVAAAVPLALLILILVDRIIEGRWQLPTVD